MILELKANPQPRATSIPRQPGEMTSTSPLSEVMNARESSSALPKRPRAEDEDLEVGSENKRQKGETDIEGSIVETHSTVEYVKCLNSLIAPTSLTSSSEGSHHSVAVITGPAELPKGAEISIPNDCSDSKPNESHKSLPSVTSSTSGSELRISPTTSSPLFSSRPQNVTILNAKSPARSISGDSDTSDEEEHPSDGKSLRRTQSAAKRDAAQRKGAKPTENEAAVDENEEETEAFNAIRGRKYKTTDSDLSDTLNQIFKLAEKSVLDNEPINLQELKILIDHAQLTRKVLADKYKSVTYKKSTTKKKLQENHPETSETVLELLRGPAELKHPWAVTHESYKMIPASGMLMRVTDEASMGKCYPEIGFLTRKSQEDLSTDAKRKMSLGLHLDYRNRKLTPWLSLTSSLRDFKELWITHFLKRDEKRPSRCTIKLHFINCYARLDAGWPTLRVIDEMKFYKIHPQRQDAPFFQSEFVMPFRIPVKQIVATYCWTAVTAYMEEHQCDFYAWHDRVVVPAFNEHQAARKERREAKIQAGCVCCGH